MNHSILLTVFSLGLFHFEIIFCKLTKLEEPIDLSWPFDEDTIYWPNSQTFVFTRKVAETLPDGSWNSYNDFCTAEHGGTHFDAPYHFNKDGWKVGDIPLSRLIVEGIMVNISAEVEQLEDKTLLQPEHLEAWEKRNGPIPENSVLLVNFGWSKHYSNRTKYLGIDSDGNLNFPGISEAAANWIVNTNRIVGVGVDTSSIDAGRFVAFPSHKILCANQIYGLENVKMPQKFPEKGFSLYVMPMKIREGTGGPLRLLAVPS